MRRLTTYFFEWLLRKVGSNMSATIKIGGISFQVSDFEKAANVIIDGVRDGKKPEQIVDALEPSLLPIVETIASGFIPYGCLAIELIAFILSKSVPFKSLPQEAQNRWMERFNIQSGA
jgi:hypothetical protein